MSQPASTTSENQFPKSLDPNPVSSNPAPARPAEIGGRDGPDPTRYGDWEKNGRCIDF
jgi:hypothetical protein